MTSYSASCRKKYRRNLADLLLIQLLRFQSQSVWSWPPNLIRVTRTFSPDKIGYGETLETIGSHRVAFDLRARFGRLQSGKQQPSTKNFALELQRRRSTHRLEFVQQSRVNSFTRYWRRLRAAHHRPPSLSRKTRPHEARNYSGKYLPSDRAPGNCATKPGRPAVET